MTGRGDRFICHGTARARARYNAGMERNLTKRTLLAGGPHGVAVEVERRRVRRLNLRVRADGTVHLSVPPRVTLAEAQRFLDGHAEWLRRHVARRLAHAAEAAPEDGLIPLWGRLVPLPEGAAPDEVYRAELARRLPKVVARMEAGDASDSDRALALVTVG